jgi:predicted HTH transcriptional regulator
MRFTPEIKYDLDELEKLISKGEGVQLDFKQSITNQKKIARTLAAFANNSGGKLLIGVKDNGFVLGCNAEEEMYMIYEAAEHFCEPPVDVVFTIFEDEEGLQVVEADIRNSLRKPHFALDEHDEWQLYMRSHDKTLMAGKNTQRLLQNEDDEKVDINDLDSKQQYVLDYLKIKEFITAKILAQKLNLSFQRANKMLVQLTRAGLVLHNKDGRGDYYVLR